MAVDEATAARLVWQGQTRQILDLPAFDSSSWVGAVQRDLANYHAEGQRLPHASHSCRAYFGAGVIMMMKDEADIISLNLNWLYSIGFRRFVIADNNSSDESLRLAEEFRRYAWNAEVVIIQDPLVRYTQSEKTTGLMRLAASYWPDCGWIFPIDADEFLVAANGLAVLDQVSPDVDALVISKVNHGLDRPHCGTSPLTGIEGMHCRSHLGHNPPKVALRPHPQLIISQGNHEVIASKVVYAPALSLGFHYREFQIRSFEQLKRRVTNGARALLAAKRHSGPPRGANHWLDWYDVLASDGDEGLRSLFERNFVGQYSINDPLQLETPSAGSCGIPAAKPPFPNVALHKPADQSSVSQFSLRPTTTTDARGAVNGSITGAGSFHTDKEEAPWWKVDLAQIHLIKEIWIHNRLDHPVVARRFSEFVIDTTIDGVNWQRIYATDQPQVVGGADGDPFILKVMATIAARFVRITLCGTDWLHLDEVEIFGVPAGETEALG
jgi:hypothetical protein